MTVYLHTISQKSSYRLSPQLSFERGALVDRCVAPIDRNGIISLRDSLLIKVPLLSEFSFSSKSPFSQDSPLIKVPLLSGFSFSSKSPFPRGI
jgi:hypothetical protein